MAELRVRGEGGRLVADGPCRQALPTGSQVRRVEYRRVGKRTHRNPGIGRFFDGAVLTLTYPM